MRGRIGRRGKGRKWMTREEVIGEGTSLDSNGACFVPDLKKHSEKTMSCSLLLRMTLTHTERIFIKNIVYMYCSDGTAADCVPAWLLHAWLAYILK